MNTFSSPAWRRLPWLAAWVLAWLAGAAAAQQVLPARVAGADEAADPPARVAAVTDRAGSVAFAPPGEQEWLELPPNRPLAAGDRIWTDPGARAELHLGTATLHLDGQSHLVLAALDAQVAQLQLLQGALHARVRELATGENFELGTPQLALRAQQPGDYRIEVDPQAGHTRVSVASGAATVYGEAGQSMTLAAGQSLAFAGRALALVDAAPVPRTAFSGWVEQRHRAEDESVAAQHLPRGVVGYPQLDAWGSWSQHPEYGAVWYPQVAAADWAPYRDGRWEWIAPWGWTWIDNAPWGFAPFHYGRWASIGTRWAWVPGALPLRPVYAPALVAFFGDGVTSISLGLGGTAVGWYPLAPGEAWWPAYRASPRYIGWLNPRIDLHRQHRAAWERHQHRHHAHAITAVGMDDFRHGRGVRERWRPVPPAALGGMQFGVIPQRPERRWQQPRRMAQPGVRPAPSPRLGEEGRRQLRPSAPRAAPPPQEAGARPRDPDPARIGRQPPRPEQIEPAPRPQQGAGWPVERRQREDRGDRGDRGPGRRDAPGRTVRPVEPRPPSLQVPQGVQPQLTPPAPAVRMEPPRQRAVPIGGGRPQGRSEHGPRGGRGER